MIVYFDLNIFDRIEKKDSLNQVESRIYSDLENLIINEQIIVPYSNAHLNDLFRGFKKNPNFIVGHLDNIQKLTNNLCICQYWGRKETTLHYRDIKEFFKYCKLWVKMSISRSPYNHYYIMTIRDNIFIRRYKKCFT